MKFLALRPAALVLGCGLFAAALNAQTPGIVIAFKANGYLQTSATDESIFDPTYGVEVEFFSGVSTATQVQLLGPVAITVPRVNSLLYETVRTFSSVAQLNAALPDGVYTLGVSGGGIASNTTVSVSSTPAIPPVLITNFDSLQALPDGNVTINWQPVVGGSRNDWILLSLQRADGTNLYTSPSLGATGALDGTSTSTTISGVPISPGETLTAYLSYLRLNIGTANSGLTGVATGTGFNVTFSVKRAPLPRPVIATQPQPLTVALGSTAVLSVSASGTGLTYQWRKNGVPIVGATGANYVIVNTQSAVAGTYTVDVTNSSGTTTSTAATLNITTTTNPGRLINLSILAPLTAGETMTMGTAIGGIGTLGSKALVARAAGPALNAFGVTGVMPDPKMLLISLATGATIANNNDWAGDPALSAAFAQVGAFPYASTNSKDAGLYLPTLTPGNYTVQVSDNTSAAGTVIAELYDATPANAFSATTPRLVNVSVLKRIAAGTTLTAGFVIAGSTAKTVLVRAVGPSLGSPPFNISGVMSDPKLELYNNATSVKLTENNDWGGDVSLTNAANSVGAFALSGASTKDAVLLVTLAPGQYSARVTGADGGGGLAITEVYEVP